MSSYLSVDPSTRTLYDHMHSRSVENPTDFWSEAAEKISVAPVELMNSPVVYHE